MDVKALAKSKRAHSQHHSKRPHNPNQKQKLKPQSPSPSNDAVGAAKKQVKEKTRQSSGLPSNWNRYEKEEELEAGSEGVSLSHAEAEADVVLPKSKGADFRFLLSEAQSQANTALALDDVLPGDFNAGLSSMLEVRGEGILSWIGDENFVVEDKTSGTHEASFLSLNLHALAENLEKINLSKRLFIEPDLLPPELRVENSAAGSNEEPDKLQSTEDSELVNRMSEQLILDDIDADVKTADQFTSSSCGNSNTTSAFTLSNDILLPVNYVDIKFTQSGNSDEDQDTKTKHVTFEASTAEDDLDMLLDSFGEAKNLDSPGFRSNSSLPVSLGVNSVVTPPISKKEAVSSKTASIAASLDDALDDLLEETSTLLNPNASLRPQEEKNVLHSMQSGSNSKVSDDFDSWFNTL